jgi:hypothetical protein
MIRVGLLSSLAVGTVALSGLGSASAALPVAGELHAPRIPGPKPAAPKPSPGFAPEVRVVNLGWTSKNWSGYALTGSTITSVVGNWRIPTVETPTKKAQLKKNEYSSTWVGIDGFNNNDLIQAGTEQDWLHGTKFYQAWWEILPAAETPITSMAVHPGDSITVTITEGAAASWTIQVQDNTTHQSFSTVKTYNGPRTSAEWIQEAPTIGRHVATLAPDTNAVFDLGRVDFADPELTSAEGGAMFKGRQQISTPSTPNPNRDGFAVAHGSVAPPAPSS